MAWSYNAGERGKGNWVRAFEDPVRGRLMLEWMEEVVVDDRVVLDDKGRPKKRRARMQLDHRDTRRAENKARELSDRFTIGGPSTAHRLIDDYLQEVTPTKGESKRAHDRHAAKLFKMLLAKDQLGEKLDRTHWDGFINARRAGTPFKLKAAGERQIQYDLKFMIAVLGWSVGTNRIPRHPWGPEIRRTQGWRMPRNRTPRRPQMTDDIRDLLIANSTSWRFQLALRLARETISRNVSIRELRWVDVDLAAAEVTWQHEKDGGTYRTPLSVRAIELLRAAPSRGIGQAFVFPREKDATQPCSRHYFQLCLRRAKRKLLANINDLDERERMRARLRGLGFHGEKRAAIRDPRFRELPTIIREALARTTEKTQREVYDAVEMPELHEAMRRIAQ